MDRKLIALALVAGCGWTTRQAALGAASTVLLAADWAQTQTITSSCREANPVLGPCGQHFPVNIYFPMVIAGSLLFGHALGDLKEVLFSGIAGAEGFVVWSNATE